MPVEMRGRSPASEEGRRFALEDDVWQVLQFVLHNAGVKVPTEWSRRQGAGIPGGDEAVRIAERLEAYMSTHPDDRFHLDLKGRATPPYDMHLERAALERFTRFLRASGGFGIH